METLRDISECSICLEAFTDPRMLPCTHTFCLKCLQQIVLTMDDQQPKDKLQCPICRMQVTIPTQGVEGLQKNFILRRNKFSEVAMPLNKSCDLCLEYQEGDEIEIPIADVYCVQCHKNICKRCCRYHKIIAELKSHQLIELGTEITENTIKTIMATSYKDCGRHKNEPAKMYCSDCKDTICMICFAENHQIHNCSGVDKAGDTFRQEIKEVASEIDKTCLNNCLRKMEQRANKKTKFEKNVENIKQKILSRKNEVNAFVDKCAQSLLENLDTILQTRLKKIQIKHEKNESQLAIVESFKASCLKIEAKGTNLELCQVVPILKQRAVEIQQTHNTLCLQPTEWIQLNFKEATFEKLVKSEELLGKIEDASPSSGKLNIPPAVEVCGVTKLENRICVLSRQPNAIRIFQDKGPFDLQMQIELQQLKNPFDIASCEKSKCLYVIEDSDSDSNIWKVTIDDRVVTKWLTGVRVRQTSLSVTSEGHLLLITGKHPYKLDIYNADAELMYRFSLPRDIYDPQHVVRNTDGEFIIIHRQGSADGRWVISRMTRDGQTVIARFHPRDETQKLEKPLQLVLDSDNNRLFVADHGRDFVMLLDAVSLNLTTTLRNFANGISQPMLFYDAKKKQLIVGQLNKQVDVYDAA